MSAGTHVIVVPDTRLTGVIRATGVVEMAGVAGMAGIDRAAGVALMRGTASDVREAPRLGVARTGGRRLTPLLPQEPAFASRRQHPCPTVVNAWIGAGPGLNEPAGFAVDLDRVLTVLPRRNFPPVNLSGPEPRRRQGKGTGKRKGRWSSGPFGGMAWPSMSRIWARGKGRRR